MQRVVLSSGLLGAVAVAVVRAARDAGVGRHLADEEIEPAVDAMMWFPTYLPYEPAES